MEKTRGIEKIPEEIADYTGRGSGIEQDCVGELNEIKTHPFDPLKVKILTKPISAGQCVTRLKQGTLNLSPDFQRNEVWDNVRKSQLIESMMLKIPLPMFYVSADKKDNYQVVDGVQRLSTIRDFVLKKTLVLSGLEYWVDYNGKNFDDLDVHLQNRITEATFQFTIIENETPEQVKRDIFKRINTGGLRLTDQEIRHALYGGKSTKLLKLLVKHEAFNEATSGSVNDSRMAGREMILRFVAFLIRGHRFYSGTRMDDWLCETMQVINHHNNNSANITGGQADYSLPEGVERLFEQVDFSLLENVESLFVLAMERGYGLFENHAFRKSLPISSARTPINKTLFETWGVILCQLSEAKYKKLFERKHELISRLFELYRENDFDRSISRDSVKAKSLPYRYDKLNRTISEVIEK